MALNPMEPAAFDFLLQVERLYASLMAAAVAGADPDQERTLGGRLLYAGEVDGEGRALQVAGNIGGAASLAATAGAAAPRQAIRDGVADFLVTSLDEALRILKNEIRKREPVAVCVAAAPEAIEREMLERGVLPDLLRPGAAEYAPFLRQGARQMQPPSDKNDEIFLTWRVAAAPAQWLPKLDAIALELLQQNDWVSRRWLRLAPRYVGRLGQGVHLLSCNREFATKFAEQARGSVEHGEIGVAVEIQVTGPSICDRNSFLPPRDSKS